MDCVDANHEDVEQRCLLERDGVGDAPRVAGRHHHVLGEPARVVDSQMCEVAADLVQTHSAVLAGQARNNALERNTVALADRCHSVAHRVDEAGYLMTIDLVQDHSAHRAPRREPRMVARIGVKVAAAHTCCLHLDANPSGQRLQQRHLLDNHSARRPQDRGQHRVTHHGTSTDSPLTPHSLLFQPLRAPEANPAMNWRCSTT